jgi:hypothetical protein
MLRLVRNTCFGGFGLSHAAIALYFELKGWDMYCYKRVVVENLEDPYIQSIWKLVPFESITDYDYYDIVFSRNDLGELVEDINKVWRESVFESRILDRSDETLVKVVEKLGTAANGLCAKLEIVDIPDDATDWYIDNYDGVETIREGRVW